ncbi:MAG: UDP-2,3-diacylglucosamine diphosphatase [Chloroherpetonaceae bacterium]|nr:UDP-2,3-diacylglucosamine diphosphatase [Chthonomonadaceae bacterium]MDW8207427.1 UDP-2,3-diacylglucosamine diphosphatase [Chloroherpetonaceae bacterium]
MNHGKRIYRSVFISDLHLGSAGCKTEQLQAFLHSVECEYLYLVGDVIDMWVAIKRGKWRQKHTNVVRTILGKSKYGCQVRYTPGNHDALVRRLNGSELGNIAIDHSFSHFTADGKKLLIVHGDLFDRSVTSLRPIAWVATWLYECLTVLTEWITQYRAQRGLGPSDFSARVKKKFKHAIQYVTSYEERIVVDAWNQGYDGVVCGHIHRPRIERHEYGGLYLNTGDWVENCTAIVEHIDGKLELIRWTELQQQLREEALSLSGLGDRHALSFS